MGSGAIRSLILGLLLFTLQLQLVSAWPAWFCNNQCYSCPAVVKQCPKNVNLSKICRDTRRFPRVQRPPCTTTATKWIRTTRLLPTIKTRTVTKYTPTRTVKVTKGPTKTTVVVVATKTKTITSLQSMRWIEYVTTLSTLEWTITRIAHPTASPTPDAILEKRGKWDSSSLTAACYCYLKLAPKKTITRTTTRKTTITKFTKTYFRTSTVRKPTTKTVTITPIVTKPATKDVTISSTSYSTYTIFDTYTFHDYTVTTLYPAPGPTNCPISDQIPAPNLVDDTLSNHTLIHSTYGLKYFFTRPYHPPEDSDTDRYWTFVPADSTCEAASRCAYWAAMNRYPSWVIYRVYGDTANWYKCNGFNENRTDITAWNVTDDTIKEAYHYIRTFEEEVPGSTLRGYECERLGVAPDMVYYLDRTTPFYTVKLDNMANPPGSPPMIEEIYAAEDNCDAKRKCEALARAGRDGVVYNSFNVFWRNADRLWVCRAFVGRWLGYDSYSVYDFGALLSYGFVTYPDANGN